MAILRSNDADHASDLDLPYLMLVAEETDTVLDDLRLTNREMRTATVIALRNIARMGRKAGVCLLAVSQSGTTDVFDAHVRKNLSNVILFRSEHTVAETWRVAGVRLSTLPAGTAYSVPHGALLSFPLTSRPRLPIWCDLPELAEPVSIAVPDWPGAPATPLLPRREPTPEDMALIRQVVNVSRSQNDAIAKLYPGSRWPSKSHLSRSRRSNTMPLLSFNGYNSDDWEIKIEDLPAVKKVSLTSAGLYVEAGGCYDLIPWADLAAILSSATPILRMRQQRQDDVLGIPIVGTVSGDGTVQWDADAVTTLW